MPEDYHMSTGQFRELGGKLLDYIAEYREGIAGRPVLSKVEPGEVAAKLPAGPPVQGDSLEGILEDLDEIVMPGITHWQSPGFFGYYPANSSLPAVLAELLCAGLGVQGMSWVTSPACTELEVRMLDWLAELLGLPDSFRSDSAAGGGVIHGTASEAVLAVMVAARDRRKRSDGYEGGMLTAYCSSQAHSSVPKAASICGIGTENLRQVEVQDDLSIDPCALEAAIEADLAAGHSPFFLCATVGTTSSCAIDSVAELGRLARRYDLWLHVDAAYAGNACVCPEFRSMIEGLELADSFNCNPHKWLLTTFDCSTLWVSDSEDFTRALSVTPEYLRSPQADRGEVIDYRDWQVPLGRRFRSLKLWFVLRWYGVDGLQAFIREQVRLAELFAGFVAGQEGFELAAKARLGLVCFRYRGSDEENRKLLDAVNSGGEIFLTHTVIPVAGQSSYVLRFATGSISTREEHVIRAWEIIRSSAPGAS
jgi:aromatic-L-amino-acid decarboxylase